MRPTAKQASLIRQIMQDSKVTTAEQADLVRQIMQDTDEGQEGGHADRGGTRGADSAIGQHLEIAMSQLWSKIPKVAKHIVISLVALGAWCTFMMIIITFFYLLILVTNHVWPPQ